MKRQTASYFLLGSLLLGCASTREQSFDRSLSSVDSEKRLSEFHLGAYPFGYGAPEILKYTASDLALKIKKGELTSLEVVEAYISQIEKRNKDINAVVFLDKEGAIRRAKEADTATKNGVSWGLLHGVPVAIKDTFMTKGLKTTAANDDLRNFTPDSDATAVALLKEAGAIILAKTNTPPMAMDMQTYNDLFGRTNNPWKVSRTAGGSSGGNAAALATGMTPLSLGSDLSGSIRQPSAYNGVYGLKPTFGAISLRGHIPPMPGEVDGMKTLAVAGPMAKSIEDLELMMNVLTKSHPSDRNIKLITANTKVNLALSDLRIAWAPKLARIPIRLDTQDKMANALRVLMEKGAKVEETSPKDFDYKGVWENWGALVGMQSGYKNGNFKRMIAKHLVKSSVPMHKRIVDTMSVPKYMEELRKQEAFSNMMENFLSGYDVWILPIGSTNAFPHQVPTKTSLGFRLYETPMQVDEKQVHYYMNNQAYTSIFNVTGQPVVVIPIGLDSDGLPIGIQIVGRKNDDFRLLKIAKLIDSALRI